MAKYTLELGRVSHMIHAQKIRTLMFNVLKVNVEILPTAIADTRFDYICSVESDRWISKARKSYIKAYFHGAKDVLASL